MSENDKNIFKFTMEGEDSYFHRGERLVDSDTLLVISGCSYAQGVDYRCLYAPQLNVHTNSYESVYHEWFSNSYGFQLGEMLNVDVVNLSKGGASNDYIVDSFLKYLPELSQGYSRVVCMPLYTSISRWTEILNDGSMIDLAMRNLEERDLNRHVRNYHMYNAENGSSQLVRSIKNMLLVRNMCKVHGFSLVEGWAFENYIHCAQDMDDRHHHLMEHVDDGCNVYKGMPQIPSRIRTMLEYLTYLGVTNHDNSTYYFDESEHPTKLGHKVIAELYYKYLRNYMNV